VRFLFLDELTRNVRGTARAVAYSQRRPNRINGIDTAIAPIIQRLVLGGGWLILRV
jgi:hypothetical protein